MATSTVIFLIPFLLLMLDINIVFSYHLRWLCVCVCVVEVVGRRSGLKANMRYLPHINLDKI